MFAKTPEDWGPLFVQAMAAGDLEAVLRLYEPDAAYVNAAGQVRHGHAELRRELALLAEVMTDFTFTTKKSSRPGTWP